MYLTVFAGANYCLSQLNTFNLPVSEFAVGALKGTVDVSGYMYNRKRAYDELALVPLFKLTDDINDADVILMPTDWSFAFRRAPQLIQYFLSISEEYGKPLIISSLGDSTKDIPGNNTIVLRTSKYRWLAKNNEIFCPPVVDDRSKNISSTLIDQKFSRPKVGFVGQSIKGNNAGILGRQFRYGYKDYIFSALTPLAPKFGPRRSGLFYRSRALESLTKDPRVEDNFIQRNHWGLDMRKEAEILRKQEQEYDENIMSNMFTVCVRGAGNFSLRLYEVLSMGRIPILIDTADIRPCEDVLDFRRFCFIADCSRISNIASDLVDFYNSTPIDQLISMQEEARTTFVNYLEFKSFSRRLFSSILPKLIKN